ncbi:MAG: hypothetical protein HUU37_00510 [Bdellovibrionales bacterium]|nr:hypothetical protein [Bdellovibrionales bacterium]
MVTGALITILLVAALGGAFRAAVAMDRRGIFAGLALCSLGSCIAAWVQARDTLFLWLLLSSLLADLLVFVHSGHTRLLPSDAGAPGRAGARLFQALAVWAAISLAAALFWVIWFELDVTRVRPDPVRTQALRMVVASYWKEGFVEIICAALLVLSALVGSVFMVERDGENE